MKHFTISHNSSSRMKKVGSSLAVALFWLVVWQLAYLSVAQEILLVSPVQAVIRLFSLAGTALFWFSVGQTCLRILAGFLFAVVAGCLLSVVCACFRPLHRLTQPLIGVIRTTPVASFIILALVWIATDRVPVFISFLVVLPVIWSNLMSGLDSVDRELLEMAHTFRFSRAKVLRYIYFPAEAPHFASACSTGLGLAWKSGVAAEVIALPHWAIGRQIYNSKIYLETVDLFAWTIAVILLSLAVEKIALWLLHKLSARLSGTILTERGETDAAAH